MVGGRCLKFVVGERCRCLWSVPMLSLLTLSLLNIGADVVVVNVVRRMLKPDWRLPTCLRSAQPRHLFIIIELLIFPPAPFLCHIKAAHSNERGALCFGRSSSLVLVALVCWCSGFGASLGHDRHHR